MSAALLSNSARLSVTPLATDGTTSATWLNWNPTFPDLGVANCPGLIVVAPHPDDETLGFGATTAEIAARGIQVQIVSVSDGGAAFPGLSSRARWQLRRMRRREMRHAAHVLGARPPIRLGLPDGKLNRHRPVIADRLTDILLDAPLGVWCAVTWRGDGHPDHEAVGAAAAIAAQRTSATLLEYPLWMWHWATPDDGAVPWQYARSIATTPTSRVLKARAAHQFRSQFHPSEWGPPPIPTHVLVRLLTVPEIAFR